MCIGGKRCVGRERGDQVIIGAQRTGVRMGFIHRHGVIYYIHIHTEGDDKLL